MPSCLKGWMVLALCVMSIAHVFVCLYFSPFWEPFHLILPSNTRKQPLWGFPKQKKKPSRNEQVPWLHDRNLPVGPKIKHQKMEKPKRDKRVKRV